MNFDFSDESKLLREQARRFQRERCISAAVRRILEGQEAYDKALWKEIADMGWSGAAIPEQYGGARLGPGFPEHHRVRRRIAAPKAAFRSRPQRG
jgi:alkylation response protein AidB-like acyl-CoA dehydrogenase